MFKFTMADYWKYSKMFPVKNKVEDTKENYNLEKDTKESTNEAREKTHQFHDKIFKEILDDREELPKFIKRYLKYEGNEELLKEELVKYNRKFITSGFKVKESDIICKARDKNVFVLIEHQSKIDYNMAQRMTEYCVEIIRSVMNGQEEKIEKIPLIYPIVLYTGNKRWDAPLTLSNIQEEYYGFPPLEYPKYNLVDINDYTKEELIQENTGISKAMLFEKLKTKEEFEEIFAKLIRKGLSRRERKYMKLMLKYSNDIRETLQEERNMYIRKLEEGKKV